MEVFEFHFNPKAQKDRIFDSFCFEPEDIEEKKLGSLYLVGELKNLLPQNLNFLNNLAKFLKKEYYFALEKSPLQALQESLRSGNEFLANLQKSGNISWLGNLNFLVLNLIWRQRNQWETNFSKVGDLKIFLLRKGKVIDLNQPLISQKQDFATDPLKIFGKVISGRLIADDKILLLTKKVSDYFLEKNLIKKLAQVRPKEIEKIFRERKKELLEISGICLLIVLEEKRISRLGQGLEREAKLLVGQGKVSLADFIREEMKKAIFAPIRSVQAKIERFKSLFWQKLKEISLKIKSFATNKITVLVFWLILILLLGFLIFRK